MDVRITPAQPKDAANIFDPQKKVWSETYVGQQGITARDVEAIFEQYSPEKTAAEIRDPNQIFFTAWVSNQLVGMCQISLSPPEIKSLYILSTFQRRGIGNMLMERAFAALKNVPSISLSVIATNTSALHFYQKFGFRKSGKRTSQRFLTATGKHIDVIDMQYFLDTRE